MHLEALHDKLPDAASADDANNLVFNVIGLVGNLSQVPAAILDLAVAHGIVADDAEYTQDGLLSSADCVAACRRSLFQMLLGKKAMLVFKVRCDISFILLQALLSTACLPTD